MDPPSTWRPRDPDPAHAEQDRAAPEPQATAEPKATPQLEATPKCAEADPSDEQVPTLPLAFQAPRRPWYEWFLAPWLLAILLHHNSSAWGVSALVHALLVVLLAAFVVPRSSRDEAALIDSKITAATDFQIDTETDLEIDLPPTTDPEAPQRKTGEQWIRQEPVRLSGMDLTPSVDAAIAERELEIVLSKALEGRLGVAKARLLKKFGAPMGSESAVGRGLLWLVRHQHPSGKWSLNDYGVNCKGNCPGPGAYQSDTAATGLALLPLLGAGNTHRTGKYRKSVRSGIDWLLNQQQPTGDLFVPGTANAHMYSHAQATIALCEVYGMSKDPKLREPATKAIQFIIRSQDSASGGWRYQPAVGSDTSVVGWQVMALKSAQMAGIPVRRYTLRLVQGWLDSVSQGPLGSRFAYQPGRPFTPTMTAEGLLCRQYLGWQRSDKALVAGADYLLQANNLPTEANRNVYYWYYGSQVMHHMGGDYWKSWNERLSRIILKSQERKGHAAGSWDPYKPKADAWGAAGGRLYVTALSLLELETYYRHLPLYGDLGIALDR